MKIYSSLVGAVLCVAASAQSPLNVYPIAPVGYFGWNTPPAIHTNLMNIAVASQITLQALATPLLTPVGQTGTLEIWLTNPGITTYVGSETIAANWTLAASGLITGNGTTGSLVTLSATSCQSIGGAGLVLNPGSSGLMLRYVGITPLLVGVGVPQTFTNAELTVSGGAIQYTPFTAPNAPAAPYTAWAWRGSFIYQPGVFPHACAESEKYGAGCYTVLGSAAQEWTDSTPGGPANASSIALTGKALQFLPVGSGYLMLPATTAFVPPTIAAIALPATDDGEATVPLTVPLNYSGGSTNTLFVHSNGIVSVGSNNTMPGGLNYVPEIATMLQATNTAWYSWKDYNPAEVGSGLIVYEEVGTTMYITFNGVESYPAPLLNPSTFQFQIDELTGAVTIVWQTMEAAGGTGFLQGSDLIVGYSPGGASPNPGQFNITTLASLSLTYPEAFPLTLNTSSKPLIGTTVNLDTTNETGFNLGINFVSVVQVPAPGLDLTFLGLPGCAALLDINAGVGNVISNLGLPGLSMSVAFPLPNNPAFAGLAVFSQSVWLDPTANPFGARTSNAVKMTLGNF